MFFTNNAFHVISTAGNNIAINTSGCNMLHNTSKTNHRREAWPINGNQLQTMGTIGVTRGVSKQISHLCFTKSQNKTNMKWDVKYIVFNFIQKHINTSIALKKAHIPATLPCYYGVYIIKLILWKLYLYLKLITCLCNKTSAILMWLYEVLNFFRVQDNTQLTAWSRNILCNNSEWKTY